MYKVLHVMNGADAGGVSTVVKNYYLHLDRDKIHFDCAITETKVGVNGNILKDYGCEIFHLPSGRFNIIKYIKKIKKILREGKYDCIHVHLNEISYYALFAGFLSKTPKRIAHAHVKREKKTPSTLVRRFFSLFLNNLFATHLCACTPIAGSYMFGKKRYKEKKINIVPNAIEINKFCFNPHIRNAVRKELGVENKFVIGNVGNLMYQKNHKLLIDIFSKIHNIDSSAILIIVGSGELEKELKEQSAKLKLNDSVIFAGKRNDVEKYYQAFDVFVLTSFFEGFGIVVLEAICSGLKCVVSDKVAQFHEEYVISKKLDDSLDEWAQAIVNSRVYDCERTKNSFVNQDSDFNIEHSAKLLEEYYLKG